MPQSFQHYIQNLLPLRQLMIVCQFREKTILPCFHQTVFPAYLYTLLDRLPPEQAKTSCRFIFPESGRTHYQAGDYYIFSVVLFGQTSLDFADELVKKITIGIQADDNRTLHNNLKVAELIDGFSGEVITDVVQLSLWKHEDLQRQRLDLQGIEDFRLWIDSGILFKTPIQSASDLTAKRVLQQLLLSVLYANTDNDIPQAEKTQKATELAEMLNDKTLCPNELLTDNHLFFVNKTYANSNGKHKHLSGYHGTIDLHIPNSFSYRELYLDILLIGQYLGLGKRTNYGVGQYHLSANKVGQKYMPTRPMPLLEHLLNLDSLTHLPEYAELSDTQKQSVLAVRDDILARCYQPSPLQTFQHTQVRLNGKQKNTNVSRCSPTRTDYSKTVGTKFKLYFR